MKMLTYGSTLVLLFLTQVLAAQLTPEQAVAEMGRGINLGNTLEPPLEGSWNNGPAQESYFDAYLEAGFANIRIPVRWDMHTANSAPFAIDESWMDRVEEVVDWGLERGFYITLNGHHEDWLKNNYNNPTLRARYDSIWVQVAARFQNKSDKLLFEIINEPNGMSVAQVDDLNERILGIIRETNPTRLVIFGGNMYANAEQLFQAAIPDDDYLIGYYHAYDPWQFSGQGQGTWGTAAQYQQLNNKYQAVRNWSDANGIPIHHSEFGAIHACDFNSRMRIYAHNVEQCIVHGFAFSVWDDGGDFGILKRNSNTWPEVKEILVHYHEDSPNQIFSNFVVDPDTDAPAAEVSWNNRATDNGAIMLERAEGGTDEYLPLAELPADATTYLDLDVEVGRTYTYRMYTTRADGTLLHGYPTRLRIPATEQTPYSATLIAIPGTVEVEEYDNGGEGLAYHDTDPANIPGGFRLDEGVDIGAFGGGYILEYVAQGEWIEYTVEVTQAGWYSVTAEVASEVANGALGVHFDANDVVTSFQIPSTGAWTAFTEINANNALIELEAGVQILRLSINNNDPFNVDRLTFTLEQANATVEAEAKAAGFLVAPNPTKGWLQVSLSNGLQHSEAQLAVYSLTGAKLRTYTLSGSANMLDLRELDSGVYLLRLVSGDRILVQRVVVE